MQSYYHRLTLAWLPQCTGQQTGNRAKRGRGKPVLQDMKNNVAILLKRLRFERYGVKTGEKAKPVRGTGYIRIYMYMYIRIYMLAQPINYAVRMRLIIIRMPTVN